MSETVTNESQSEEISEILVAVMSFFIPGLGQLYVGQTKRGAIWLGATIGYFVLSSILVLVAIGFLMYFALPLFAIGAAVDAYMQADKINSGEITV